MNILRNSILLLISAILFSSCSSHQNKTEETKTTFEGRKYLKLDVNESKTITLYDGTNVTIKLLDIIYDRDEVRKAVRSAKLKLSVDGEEKWIEAGNYNLPVHFKTVKIDCPIAKAYLDNGNFPHGMWRLLGKEVKLRVWPVNSKINPNNMVCYPIDQKWLSANTTAGLEPVEIDHDNLIPNDQEKIYYHWGFDFAGVKGVTPALAGGDGVVIAAGKKGYEEPDPNDSEYFKDEPFFNVSDKISKLPKPRFDRIFVRMENGWIYRYSHLQRIDVQLGDTVKAGQVIGALGNRWSDFAHIHFEVWSIDEDDNNNYTLELGYPYLWESYVDTYKPKIIAIARPHKYITVGDSVTLDGLKSVSFEGKIVKYEWTFHDGTTATGASVTKQYNKPGYFSETLKITDDKGNVEYDFVHVTVVYKDKPNHKYGYTCVSYYPTFNIKAGDELTFKGRFFNINEGEDHWDFGDGTPIQTTHSNPDGYSATGYVELKHTYKKPGHYFVTFDRTVNNGMTTTTNLSIFVK
jgi:murein DD-endopeptidase MepM/ murein hydrolase activator NlpD